MAPGLFEHVDAHGHAVGERREDVEVARQFLHARRSAREALGGSASPAHVANALSQPLDFSFERLEGAESSLARIAGTAQNLRWAAAHATGEPDAALAQKLADAVAAADAEFKACMNDDFNTAGALGAFFGFITEANSYLDAADGAVNARW